MIKQCVVKVKTANELDTVLNFFLLNGVKWASNKAATEVKPLFLRDCPIYIYCDYHHKVDEEPTLMYDNDSKRRDPYYKHLPLLSLKFIQECNNRFNQVCANDFEQMVLKG